MTSGPGIRSTEFWVTMVLILLIAFNKKLGLDLDIEQIIGILTMSGIYTAARAAPKVTAELAKGKSDAAKEGNTAIRRNVT